MGIYQKCKVRNLKVWGEVRESGFQEVGYKCCLDTEHSSRLLRNLVQTNLESLKELINTPHTFQNVISTTPTQVFVLGVLEDREFREENKNVENLLFGIPMAFAGIFIVAQHAKK